MAEAITVARPYAEAIYKLAVEMQALDAWSKTLWNLALVANDEQIKAINANPSVSAKQLSNLFLDICGSELTDESRNFVTLMAENGRVDVLPQVSELFEQLKARHDGMLDAKIVSAFAMNDGQLSKLVASLEQKFKRKIEAKVSVDPELIGGVKVEVGDEVLDSSVRGKLEAMAIALKS